MFRGHQVSAGNAEVSMRIATCVVTFWALMAASAAADDGVFEGSGGTVVLSRTDNVRMVAEEVVFDLTEPDVIHVSCVFVVVNEGPEDRLFVGFPDYWPSPDDDSQRADGRSAISDLVIMVDGLRVATRAVPVDDAPGVIGPLMGTNASYNQAHIWECAFAPGQTRVLRTEYRHVYSGSTSASHVLSYVLRTGASWKGPIGKVVVRIKRGAMRLKCPWYPRDWILDGDEYVWTSAELDPDHDIAVGLEDPVAFARHLVGSWRWATKSTSARGQEVARKYLRDAITFGDPRPEFLVEVYGALGDTVPDLRRYMQELLAAPRTRSPAEAGYPELEANRDRRQGR